MISNHDRLKVVNEAHKLVMAVYRLTNGFPKAERFRLTDQLCRSMSSVPANIVEGNSRKTSREYVQFLYQAKGSLAETQYHLRLAKDLKYLDLELYDALIRQSDQVGKLISGLIRYQKSKSSSR